jgi:hypothetical protein
VYVKVNFNFRINLTRESFNSEIPLPQ